MEADSKAEYSVLRRIRLAGVAHRQISKPSDTFRIANRASYAETMLTVRVVYSSYY